MQTHSWTQVAGLKQILMLVIEEEQHLDKRTKELLTRVLKTPTQLKEAYPPYLWECRVQLKNLSLSFHLAHTYLTGQVHRAGRESLQGEAAVQVSLRTAPHLLKAKLLQRDRESGADLLSCQEACEGTFSWRQFTWYLASSLLFHNVCGTSWMESLRLWVLSLKLRVFGSSNNFPPICFSICRTSWKRKQNEISQTSLKKTTFPFFSCTSFFWKL